MGVRVHVALFRPFKRPLLRNAIYPVLHPSFKDQTSLTPAMSVKAQNNMHPSLLALGALGALVLGVLGFNGSARRSARKEQYGMQEVLCLPCSTTTYAWLQIGNSVFASVSYFEPID